MNPYELITKIKGKMKDPNFAARFNNAANVVIYQDYNKR